MSAKMRLGLILLGAGVILLVLFLALFDPNAVLRRAARETADADGSGAAAAPVDTQALGEFLTAYNERYLALYREWQDRRRLLARGEAAVDSFQVQAARNILLSFAGRPETIATLQTYSDRSGLPDLPYRQVQVARRLAGLRPGTLAPRALEFLETASHDPEELPLLFRRRNLAARAVGYDSWLALQADDQSLDIETWWQALRKLTAADSSLYRLVLREAVRRIDPGLGTDGHAPLPCDILGSGGPGTFDKVLAALDGKRRKAPQAWSRALDFRAALKLSPLPTSLTHSPPIRADSPDLFSLDLAGNFAVLLPAEFREDGVVRCTGLLAGADVVLACARADLPPILRGPACRAMGRAFVHLYELAARSSLAEDGPDAKLADDLLRQAVAGPVLAIPLYAGAYREWLDGVNRGLVPTPVIETRFWEAAGKHALLAPPSTGAPGPRLPAAAFGTDAAVVAPLDDVLGWAIAHQLHRYICTRLLDGDVHRADYRGDARVADFLDSLLRAGKGVDWQILLRQATGEDFDPAALVEYYQPLADRLASP